MTILHDRVKKHLEISKITETAASKDLLAKYIKTLQQLSSLNNKILKHPAMRINYLHTSTTEVYIHYTCIKSDKLYFECLNHFLVSLGAKPIKGEDIYGMADYKPVPDLKGARYYIERERIFNANIAMKA